MTRGQILSERIKLKALALVQAEGPDLEVIQNENTVKGLGRSGATIVQRHDRRLRTLEELLAERIRLEKEHPLAPEDEERWYSDLLETLMLINHDQQARLYRELEADTQRILGRSSEPFVGEVKPRLNQLSYLYLEEAELMKAEREHRKEVLPATVAPVQNITLNINNSQVAGLNVAGTVDNIQATVNSLQAAGAEKLAEALKALAEAIPASPSLSDREKRESLELVSAVGDELARPPEQRRVSVLKGIGNSPRTTLSSTGKLYALYEVVKLAARVWTGQDLLP